MIGRVVKRQILHGGNQSEEAIGKRMKIGKEMKNLEDEIIKRRKDVLDSEQDFNDMIAVRIKKLIVDGGNRSEDTFEKKLKIGKELKEQDDEIINKKLKVLDSEQALTDMIGDVVKRQILHGGNQSKEAIEKRMKIGKELKNQSDEIIKRRKEALDSEQTLHDMITHRIKKILVDNGDRSEVTIEK